MLFLPAFSILFAIAIQPTLCDFLGLTYPAPRDLTSSKSVVRAAWEDVSAVFDAGLKQGKNMSATQDLLGTERVTFSSGLFSLYDDAATELQYHYTAPQIANAKQGTNEVDANSIYRVASVTKLITVLLGMVQLSNEDWSRPITDIIPEFGEGLNDQAPEWDKITLWDLASHQAGLTASGVINDYLIQLYLTAVATNTTLTDVELDQGLPPMDAIPNLGPCYDAKCTQEQFVAATRDWAPIFASAYIPEYSNVGLMILGMAISRVIGQPYDQMYQDTIFTPLGMTSSLVNAPLNGSLFDRSVIVTTPLAGTWSFPYDNPTIPSGGILSTINDLDKLGVALLNSTLLSPDVTRRWMKPRSHTASMSYSIGAPWEITRYVHKGSGKVTDIYAKLGDSGSYGGMVALIPEYGAGFSLLNALYETSATPIRGEAALVFINHIAEAIIPALEAQAAAEATSNYAGTYASSDANVNSSIEIAFDKSTIPHTGPSMSIASWVSNNTDMIKEQFGGLKPRLLLSIPQDSQGAGNVTFQATVSPQWNSYTAGGFGPYTGFYDSNWDSYAADGPRYAGGGLYSFTFEIDRAGAAVAVSNHATRLRMEKS